MLGKAGVLFLLAFCVGQSYQICHNGICDPEDRCNTTANCPTCYTCDDKCGTCLGIKDCCTSHQICPDWDGVCDADSKTCNYCAFDEKTCKPGCVDQHNCPAGFKCHEHQCQSDVDKCTDDAYCNAGLPTPIKCDVENSPYTQCFYCESGDCLPGCLTDDNCQGSYTCNTADHTCHHPSGKVLVESITVRTKTGCTDCSKEGVTLSFLGKKDGDYPNGVPCSTRVLDHPATIDFDGTGGSWARFDGTEDDKEKEMMGGCYEAPLNSYLNGGSLVWSGASGWEPLSVCVDWQSNDFAWTCTVTKTGANTWNLVYCHDLTPKTKCNQ